MKQFLFTSLAAQLAILSFTSPSWASTSTCSIDWSDVVGLRVDVDDSQNCGGSSSNTQNPSASANLKDGDNCSDYVLAITVRGSVEDEDSGFDFVYVNGTLYFSSRGSNADCSMLTQTETRQITVKATDPIVLEYDTIDGLYHTGAYAEITKVSLVSGPGCDQSGCSTCGGAGGGSAGNSSVDVRVSLGDAERGLYPGMFRVKTETPDSSIYTTAGIEYGVDIDAGVEEISDESGAIRQVLTSQILADVVTLAARKYKICFYYAADAGSKSGNVYVPTGSPYKVWTFEDPDNGTGNDYRLKVTESSGSSDTTYHYTWIPANQDWKLVSGGLKEISRSRSISGSDRIETYWVKAPNGSETYRRETLYQTFAWGEEKVSETLDPLNPSGGRTTTWTYYTDPLTDGDNYGKLNLIEKSDGYWERYEYDSDARIIKTVSPAGNSSPIDADALCRVVEWIHQTSAPQVTRIERYKGQEVERRYTVYNGNITQEILAATPGAAWDAIGNLVTQTERVGGYGEFSDRVAYTGYSDGTLQHQTYSRDGTTGELTVVTSIGAADAAGTSVVDGRKTTRIEDVYGNLISETVEDIASGLTLAFKFVTSADELGRPLQIGYLDGTSETFVYSCCGLSTHTDREGIVTSYFYDVLKRRTSEVRNGISYEHVYDASDRVIEEARVGTDASRMVLAASAYGPDERLLWTKDGRSFKSNYSYGQTGDGGETVTVTHEADSSTRIQTFYRDRKIAESGGTAASPIKYNYGAEAGGLSWSQEIRIGLSGSETEWTKTYENMSGKITRVEYSDTAETTYAYNSLGQLIRQTDPDGVQTLYAYNDSGQQTVQALDINQNGLIDYAGMDRIERVTTEVLDISGTIFVRKTVEHWNSNEVDTPSIYYVTQQSADGFQRAQTINGQTEQTVLSYDGSGARTETITKADGTSILNRFDKGRIVSSTIRDVNDQTIRSTTYAYGPHGRLFHETLADVGTTSYTYAVDNQIASLTTPDPDTNLAGEGFDALTTQYEYDGRGRLIKITHHDGAETHNSYYPTGKIKRTWGARSYPVEYAYDPQQRVTSMKTWKDFVGNSGAATTQWAYHPQRGWLTAKIHADGNGPSYTYTPAGRLETRTWARGISTTYSYEDGGELDSITYSDATPPVTYTHKRGGAVHTVSDAAGLLTLTRADGGILGEAYTGSGILSGKSLARGFDGFNRVNSLGATSVADVSLSYDDASRLTTVTQGSRVATYTHGDAAETIDQVRIENSGTGRYRLSRTRDLLGRVTRIDTLGNGSTLHTRRDYRYNNANQRTEVSEKSGRKWSFDYDSLGQVAAAQKLDSGGDEVLPGFDFAYAFDDIGNRVSTGVNERTASYSSNAINQYTQRDYPGAVDVRGHAPGHVGVIVNSERTERAEGDFYAPATADNSTASVKLDIVVKAVDPGPPELLAEESRTALLPQDPESFVYDLDGNLTRDGLWTYVWDAENRLVSVESRTDLPAAATCQRLEFAYDSRSRRIQKTVKEYDSGTSSWTTTAQIKFLYDGWNLLAEYDALNSDTPIRSHVWGLDLSGTPQGSGGVGGLLWSSQAGADYAPGFDANGNIIAWVDLGDGSLAGTAEYGAFGETLVLRGISAQLPFGFSTKYQCAETGLYYYGFRYYDADTGRWPSRDPLHEFAFQYLEGYQPDSLLEMRYAFVGNDPANHWDLLGLKIVDDPDKDIRDMLDDIFDALDKQIDGAFDKCQSKTGCIGSKSKCETCCGFAGIGLTLTATGKHWTARARCAHPGKNAKTFGFYFYWCVAEAAVKYGEVLTKIKDKTDSCRTSCPCRDSDCGN